MKSGLKIVFIYGTIAVVIFVLQLIPATGIVMMFFLGPFWISALVHLMMIHLAIVAAGKDISRGWLLLPGLFYGASFGLFGFTYWRATVEAAEIERANAAAKVSISEPYTFLVHGNEPGFIERYRIDRLYQHEYGDNFSTWMTARGGVCGGNKNDPLIEGQYRVTRSDLFPDYHGSDKVQQCSITRRGLADANYRYVIRSDVKRSSNLLAMRTERVWTVAEEKSGVVVTTVRTAEIGSSSIVFFAFIGCGLNSGAPSWDCGFQMTRDGRSVAAGYRKPPIQPVTLNPPPFPDPEMLQISAVARALSIPLRTPTD
jgi:hypothetical protein